MPVYYVMQDNTIFGCGDSECCGADFEDIYESFLEVSDEEENTHDAIISAIGGGPILEFRKATDKELIAYMAGRSAGFELAYDNSVKREISNAT